MTLIVIGVEGDLEAHEVAEVEALAQYRRVEDIVQVRGFPQPGRPDGGQCTAAARLVQPCSGAAGRSCRCEEGASRPAGLGK